MVKNYNKATQAEWPYPVAVDELESGPRTYHFEADERERIDLARRYGVPSIERAEATVTLQPVGGGTIQAMGTVVADVTQSCVITLEPISSRIEEAFEGWFGDKSKAVSFARARNEREARKGYVECEILEESVDPEPVIGGKVDIGELAAQYLSLALDSYPHLPGAEAAYAAHKPGDEAGASLRKSPFEALKDWKEKR
ncbi:MAG: hypothetical protein WC989_01455 [Micavibrio sp.]